MSDRLPTYIERIAQAIWWKTGETAPWYPADELPLWLGYATLCIAKGKRTTSFDVHQAWSAWAVIKHDGHHRSLIPWEELSADIRAYDDLYRDAIRAVAEMLGQKSRAYSADEIVLERWHELRAQTIKEAQP